MSGIKITQVVIHNGEVLSTVESDVLALDYLEELAGLQYRIAQDCSNAWSTQSGVIRENSNGLLEVFTVIAVP